MFILAFHKSHVIVQTIMSQLEKKCLLSLILCLIFKFSFSIDTITSTQPLRDGDFLVSTNQVFALGFFSPGISTRRFVGIWYNKVPETVVWVANRDNPINGTAGILTVDNRNLVLYENNKTRVSRWSSMVNVSSTTSFKAQLLDSGNLVLVDQKNSSNRIWESFDFPTDTTIPNMKLGQNRKTGKNWFLSSWKSIDDPGTGNIFLRINPAGFPQVFLYNGSVPLWRGGPWIGQRWSGTPLELGPSILPL
ncbi:G-type lectin S-receptor-like serine/threonine-protein kinase RKS1 [Euphorbia lathyris]|uniref:G-type lectin S-receptor-like serine/threonine-protein kinase RKS1 n=1 Tax=Euphorbia lathyris TaxID=212925 RepID=UPI00331355BE